MLSLTSILLLVSGCGINRPMQAELAENPALKGSVELQNLAYFPQEADQCGPASLATMLASNGIETTPEQLRPQVYIPGRGGSLGIELVARARQHGLIVYPLAAKLEDILLELDANHPVLVMQNLGFSWFPKWHFAVAIGYDLEQQVILLRSGPDRRYATDLTLFKKTWDKAGNWAQTILPPTKLPATVTQSRYMQAASALELTGKLDAAGIAYQSADKRWPDTPMILMGLGNTRYAQQDFASAARYFRDYIEHSTDPAPGWNNLAYSLQKLGCNTAAVEAATCAVAIAPGQANYADSLRELSSDSGSLKSLSLCQLPDCLIER
ncbi:MAG: PA2778 family cysteine peptidase [Amphritea sp.]